MNQRLLWVALTTLAVGVTGCASEDQEDEETTSEESDLGESESGLIGGRDEFGRPAVVGIVNSKGGLCTGTLIAPKTVLTAAHCLTVGAAYRVVFIQDIRKAFLPDTMLTSQVFLHPSFRATQPLGPEFAANDIAILRLPQNAPIPPASINRVAVPTTLKSVVAVGYGKQARTANAAFGERQSATLKVNEVGTSAIVTGSVLNSGASLCQGDSGGPIFATVGTRSNVLVGVTSFGDANCRYGVSSRVDKNIAFISKFLK